MVSFEDFLRGSLAKINIKNIKIKNKNKKSTLIDSTTKKQPAKARKKKKKQFLYFIEFPQFNKGKI
jgi:hypothetical protein